MNIVVVESPAKAKTINKYLGKDYRVVASYGHVRDLSAKDGSVRPEEDFALTWTVDERAEKRLKDIAAALPKGVSAWKLEIARKRCHIGQPVKLARHGETWIGALRLCAGARIVSGTAFDPALGATPEVNSLYNAKGERCVMVAGGIVEHSLYDREGRLIAQFDAGAGSPLALDNDLTLFASGLPPHVFGFVILGTSAGWMPGAWGAQGNLCIATPFVQIGGVRRTTAQGSLQFTPDLSALPPPAPSPVQAGDLLHFQVWYRDFNPWATSNFTDGLRVLFL